MFPITRTKSDSLTLLRLALPAMATQISLTLVQLIDTMFIGQLGPLALGASAITGIIIFNITAVGDGFSTGMVATIARMVGEGDRKNAEVFSTTGIVILILLGGLMTPLLLLGAPALFRFMQIDGELSQTAWDYYWIFIAFVPAIFGFIALSASFRARGDTRTPMMVGFGLNLINILLDWLLIFGKGGFPALGIRGAALASGISFLTGCTVLAAISLVSPAGLLTPKRNHVSLPHFIRILKIGVPSMLERFAMSFSQLLVMALAVTPLGSAALASFHIVMRLASLSFMPGFGFAIAAASLTGQHLGASDPDGAERMMWTGTFYCALVMGLISFTYFLFPHFLTGLFTSSREIISGTAVPLKIYAVFAIFLAPAMVLRGGLQGAGDTMFTLRTMIVSRFIIRLPLAWVLGIYLGWGLSGVWLAMSTDFLLRGFVFAIHTRQGRWRTIEV